MRILALIPSEGHGGGIEAYVEALLEEAQNGGAVVSRCVLTSPDNRLPPPLPRKLRFAWRAVREAGELRHVSQACIFAFLPSLAGVALLARLAAGRSRPRVTVFFHGSEIWGARISSRWLWRRGRLQLVSVSSFSAGALARFGAAQILSPGISRARYERLLDVPLEGRHRRSGIRLLSVFRLQEAELKGGFVVLAAVRSLRADGVDARVTFAGFGTPPPSFATAVEQCAPWASIVGSPSDDELANLYDDAGLFVLATRLRAKPIPSGEGFGIVLVEAALAGKAVIAPAFGGSADAMLEGLTGLRPKDESVGALVEVLRWFVENPARMRLFGINARTWATERFRPENYRNTVSHVLFGGTCEPGDLAIVKTVEDIPTRGRSAGEE